MIFLKLINEININMDLCRYFAFIAKHFSQGVSKNLLSDIYIYIYNRIFMSNYLIHRINFMKIFKIKMLKERQFYRIRFFCLQRYMYMWRIFMIKFLKILT